MADPSITRLWTFRDGTTAPDAPPPLSDSEVNDFKRNFGLDLPPSLIELYRQQNGGFSERHLTSLWSIERGENTDVVTLRRLATTYHKDDELESEWKMRLGDLDRVVVFMGDGHFYFVLNYNDLREGEPTIWYVAGDQIRSTRMSFSEWLFSDGQNASQS